MRSILDSWDAMQPLTAEEQLLIRPISFAPVDCAFSKRYNDWFLARTAPELMPTHVVSMNYTASQLIHSLFQHYVDDSTLVITTDLEHESVNEECMKVKHHVCLPIRDLDQGQFDLSLRLVQRIIRYNKFKKAFVYMLGTSYNGRFSVANEFFVALKKIKCEFLLCLDAVQEVMLTPRDYTIFDYVIGTAHSLVLPVNMGYCFSRKDLWLPGHFWYNWIQPFFARCDVVLSRKNKLDWFADTVKEYFKDKPVEFYKTVNNWRVAFSIPLIEQAYLDSNISDLSNLQSQFDLTEAERGRREIMSCGYTYISGGLSTSRNFRIIERALCLNDSLI